MKWNFNDDFDCWLSEYTGMAMDQLAYGVVNLTTRKEVENWVEKLREECEDLEIINLDFCQSFDYEPFSEITPEMKTIYDNVFNGCERDGEEFPSLVDYIMDEFVNN